MYSITPLAHAAGPKRSHDNGRAEIILTPPQLGRIEVSINMNGDQASANFVAVNPIARDALQDALPRLRELLAQSGIELAQADVRSGQSDNGAQGQANGRATAGGGSGSGADIDLPNTPRANWLQSGRGVIDTFA